MLGLYCVIDTAACHWCLIAVWCDVKTVLPHICSKLYWEWWSSVAKSSCAEEGLASLQVWFMHLAFVLFSLLLSCWFSLGMLAGLLHRIVLHEALLVVTTNKEGIGPRAPHSHGFHQQLHLLPMDISKLPNIWVCHHSMLDRHNHMVDTLNSQL